MATRTTFGALVRSGMGRGKRASPVALGGYIRAQLPADVTTAQQVGILPAGCAIVDVIKLGTAPAAGTAVLELPADAANILAQADVVDSTTLTTLGSFTVDAESKYKHWSVDRPIMVTFTSGSAGATVDLAVMVIPLDDGAESN